MDAALEELRVLGADFLLIGTTRGDEIIVVELGALRCHFEIA